MALKVDTNIPYGNACDIAVTEEDGMPVVSFAADPHGGPECLWFCFRLAQARGAGTRRAKVKLVLKHPYNMLGGNEPRTMRPVMRPARGDWERLGPGAAVELPDGRRYAEWIIDAPKPFADIAFCYPYGRPEIDTLLADTKGYWQADTIGVSQGARPLIRLSNGPGEVGGQRPGLYLIARQHSGEAPGSWALDGFLRYIASQGDKAPLVWAVPLSNIDGVEQGDYGKDNFPYDLNRAWGNPPMRHEVLVFQRDMQRWKKRCKPAAGIDFHAPGGCDAGGIFMFTPNPQTRAYQAQATTKWVEALAAGLTPQYAHKNFRQVATYASRWETPWFTEYCFSNLGVCELSLETPYGMIGETVLTRENYREAGARIAEAVMKQCLIP